MPDDANVHFSSVGQAFDAAAFPVSGVDDDGEDGDDGNDDNDNDENDVDGDDDYDNETKDDDDADGDGCDEFTAHFSLLLRCHSLLKF